MSKFKDILKAAGKTSEETQGVNYRLGFGVTFVVLTYFTVRPGGMNSAD